jgi:hypothetical protein
VVVQILIGAVIALAALGVLVLIGPISWSRVFPELGMWAARRTERISPRLARWYEGTTEDLRTRRPETDGR